MMNMNRSKSGQGMTEYIIIIAIVAVAALLVTAMFGKQIKNTLGKITGAMGGQDTESIGNVTIQESALQRDTMGTFDDVALEDITEE
ncbi:MAG: hypothetical protein H7A43_07430 [Verrucomicrobia bacterium]|nr:hypothetical protein [Kiritimatiellia bacterium]MCB1102181.1 hypothetical protein [Kiritimatiellia bacterium]MCP5488466.1 hypothetical protein [Verrucomicrobiota bacterium]